MSHSKNTLVFFDGARKHKKLIRENAKMTAVNVYFKTAFQSQGTLKGDVQPVGASGYRFTGTLTCTCDLDRRTTSFVNTVRVGHGGTSSGLTYNEYSPVVRRPGPSSFDVALEGGRNNNETVDFQLGFNEGLSGQYTDGNRVTSQVG